jgi:hypothetical protein
MKKLINLVVLVAFSSVFQVILMPKNLINSDISIRTNYSR